MKKDRRIRHLIKLRNEKGSVLLTTFLLVTVLLILGAAFVVLSSNEARISERHRLTSQAFNVAEAGIERVIYYLKRDFDADQDWSDDEIDGWTYNDSPANQDADNYFPFPDTSDAANAAYPASTLSFPGSHVGSYYISLKSSASDGIWVRSVGTINDSDSNVLAKQTIEAYMGVRSLSPWNNAIFAGSGAAGTTINGNVTVAGSVHILGEGLTPLDYGIYSNGNAAVISNNYDEMDGGLKAKLPALPQVDVNGEMSDTLSAELRVKNGMVGLDGAATAGHADVAGNSIKEELDGAYVDDGYDGSFADAHSDKYGGYDLGDALTMPSLSDTSIDDPTKTVQEYYKTQALVLTNELSDIKPGVAFVNPITDGNEYTDGTNSIKYDGNVLTITGQIYVDAGNELKISKNGGNKTIVYDGTGTILVDGDADIQTDLMTSGATYPQTDIIAIMASNNLSIGTNAGTDVMGLFYAENQISMDKQTEVAGTIISNFYDMGTNVPSIFQVPTTMNNLPPGLVGTGNTIYLMRVISWRKIDNPS